MADLGERDLRDVLEIVGEIHHAEDLPAFRAAIVDVLPRVIPADYVGYNEVDWDGTPGTTVVRPQQSSELHLAYQRWGHQNPLLRRYMATRDGRAYRFSDVVSREELHALEVYTELLAPMRQEHQLAVVVPAPPRLIIGIVMGGAEDFTDRQRRVLDLARPHIIQAHRNAAERDRLRVVVDALTSGLDDTGEAMVVLDDRGHVEFATAAGAAALMLVGGRERAEGQPLPAAVARAITATQHALIALPEGAPLVVRRVPAVRSGATVLVFERGTRGASRELLEGLGLTPREAEVLQAMMRGSTTAAIAEALGISPRTVHKHVERIFSKLGVRDRIEAVSAAWAAIDAPLVGT